MEYTENNEKFNLDPCFMPLMNTAFKPGKCADMINSMEDGVKKEIASAEYFYFSGHTDQAAEKMRPYLECEDIAVRLSACLIYGYASLSTGKIYQAKTALGKLQEMMKMNTEESVEVRALKAFVLKTASVLLHLPVPEEVPDFADYLHLLPRGIQVFAFYVQAHYRYLREEYERSLGIIEAALAMQEQIYPIPTIYMHLVAAMDYMSLRNPGQAKEHLLAAWELARPDDLIEGFGEHHGLLGGLLETVIKKKWPEDFKRIISITYEFSAGWRKIHNPNTGHDVADNLTTTEFATAMLAARGWTNKEIADHMNVSVNTVKSCISTVLHKLNISHRQELKKYMLR